MLLVLPPLGALAALGTALVNSDPSGILIGAIVCLFVAALYGLLVFPMRYGVGSEELIIRFGVVRQRIQFAAIEEVAPTRNPLSSPALSLDRLAVRTGPGLMRVTMISPEDQDAFLKMLALRAGLRLDAGRVVREVGKA
jgi:hypothetical protein